eukprot:gnl/MRDRNA2_/MRDRNA2_84101_c0_seq2.p2 gnl/MRDRNA2_/MRDRNA2_84101_c0~~gnl/MRDRNA2_/MRDRNA2_84101_c0_seq2.p2  ORF type:complete len:141 (-),score=27.51 gnl/MRDRNA2_/MRDRNA2_84101_c0_seq2:26-448(-)
MLLGNCDREPSVASDVGTDASQAADQVLPEQAQNELLASATETRDNNVPVEKRELGGNWSESFHGHLVLDRLCERYRDAIDKYRYGADDGDAASCCSSEQAADEAPSEHEAAKGLGKGHRQGDACSSWRCGPRGDCSLGL